MIYPLDGYTLGLLFLMSTFILLHWFMDPLGQDFHLLYYLRQHCYMMDPLLGPFFWKIHLYWQLYLMNLLKWLLLLLDNISGASTCGLTLDSSTWKSCFNWYINLGVQSTRVISPILLDIHSINLLRQNIELVDPIGWISHLMDQLEWNQKSIDSRGWNLSLIDPFWMHLHGMLNVIWVAPPNNRFT